MPIKKVMQNDENGFEKKNDTRGMPCISNNNKNFHWIKFDGGDHFRLLCFVYVNKNNQINITDEFIYVLFYVISQVSHIFG